MKVRIVLIYKDDLSTDQLDPLKRLVPDFFEEFAICQTPLDSAEGFLKESGEFTFCFFQQGMDRNMVIQLIGSPKTKIVEGISIEDMEIIKFFGLKKVDKKKTST